MTKIETAFVPANASVDLDAYFARIGYDLSLIHI